MTIWWTSGYHCLTCGVFSTKGCKEHRAGNIPATAIIEATLDDVKILSDGMAEMIVGELRGTRQEVAEESGAAEPQEESDAFSPPQAGEREETLAAAEEEQVDEVPEHFLVSDKQGKYRCSCGLKFESEHVFMSHLELEAQLS